MKKEPHLKFTDQELAENTPVGNAARKAKKAAERADKADAKIPRRKKPKVKSSSEACSKTIHQKCQVHPLF